MCGYVDSTNDFSSSVASARAFARFVHCLTSVYSMLTIASQIIGCSFHLLRDGAMHTTPDVFGPFQIIEWIFWSPL